jgi:hypothetical protein
MVQPRLRDRDRGETVGLSQLGDEVHLTERIARVPLGFYIDAALYAPACRVGAVVGDPIRFS